MHKLMDRKREKRVDRLAREECEKRWKGQNNGQEERPRQDPVGAIAMTSRFQGERSGRGCPEAVKERHE